MNLKPISCLVEKVCRPLISIQSNLVVVMMIVVVMINYDNDGNCCCDNDDDYGNIEP